MKKFIGKKEIMAEPMGEENAYILGYGRPTLQNREGYHVQYTNPDGSKYDSWSPKDVFEAAYHAAETALDRVRIEKDELNEKATKLGVFILSEKFKGLSDANRALLIAQMSLMVGYHNILCMRDTAMETGKGSLCGVSFGVAIPLLEAGFCIRRSGWNGKGLFVCKQVSARIEGDVIPNMQSLPEEAKKKVMGGKKFIDYTSQCLIYNENTGRADSWVPSISDVFANDWELA